MSELDYLTVTNNNNNSRDHSNRNGNFVGKMGNEFENFEQGVDTESNCSMEDAVAKLEYALRKNFKAQCGEAENQGDGDDEGSTIVDEDPTQLKGYQPIPENMPEWKKAMIKKKNEALVEDYMKSIAVQKAEEDKWDGVPEWKKKLIMEKEKKKVDDSTPEAQEAARIQAEQERLSKLPAWKRDLVMKKKGDV